MNIIETRSLTKYYGKSRGIIDLDLKVKKGKIFGFIGPNGAGKSTTIRTLLAFLIPTSGSAEIFGMDCIRKAPLIKKRIGYLPAEVNYYDDMRVKDLFNYVARLRRKDCRKKMKELSDVFELDLNQKIISLSSGNKKKVTLILSLLHEPELLILDEPAAGLDPLMQSRFFELLRKEKSRGVTVFFSSHVLSDVQKVCDRVAIIKEGRIIKEEQMGELEEARYKKIKIVFSGNRINDREFKISGVENMKVKGNTIEFYYSGKVDDVTRRLSNITIDDIWIEDPSLEEIFMHYYEKEEK